jgi:hypothetical protein
MSNLQVWRAPKRYYLCEMPNTARMDERAAISRIDAEVGTKESQGLLNAEEMDAFAIDALRKASPPTNTSP